MSTGSNINTTLTLDASKFTSALEKATSNLTNFDKNLETATKVATDFEKNVSGLGSGLAKASEKFKLLDQTMNTLVSRLAESADKINSIGRATSSVRKSVDEFAGGINSAKQSLSGITKESETYRAAMNALDPAIQKASKSYYDLTEATKVASKATREASEMSSKDRIKAIETERATNQRIISERKALIYELNLLENKLNSSESMMRGESSRYFGKNAAKSAPLKEQADQYALEAKAARDQAIAVNATVKELEWKNSELVKGLKLEEETNLKLQARREQMQALLVQQKEQNDLAKMAASQMQGMDKQNLESYRSAMNERKRMAQENADAEMAQARQVADMWKGMAQMWAASKVEHGLMKVVEGTSAMQTVQMRTGSQGLSPKELEEFNSKAYDLSRQNKYLSNIDAIKARLSALTSLGINDQKMIDGTVGDAVKTVQALQFLGYDHGDMQDSIKNLYGVSEARQVMNDPNKVRETNDAVFRGIRVSDGKLDLKDYETVFRSMGSGAQSINAGGIANLTALMEQFKVAGTHGGGASGAGVSSVGTILKMFELYAGGKTESDNAVKELAGSGIIDADAAVASAGTGNSKMLARAAKNAGWKNSAQMLQNPVEFAKSVRDPILKYMEKNSKVYFANGGQDTEEGQVAAFNKFGASAGWSNKMIQAFTIMMDPRFQERTQNVVNREAQGSSAEQVVKSADNTIPGTMAQIKRATTDLTTAFMQVSKPIEVVGKAIASVISAAASFMKENPLTANLTLAGIAAAGLTLAIKGFSSVFGVVGGLSTLLKGVATSSREAAISTDLLATAQVKAGRTTTVTSGFFTGFYKIAESTSVGAVSKLALIGEGVKGLASTVAKNFMKMIPFVGELLIAWDLANVVANLEIGGHQIKDWMSGLIDWLFTKASNGWERIKDVFTLGMNHAEHKATIAENNAEFDQRYNANLGDPNAQPFVPAKNKPKITDKPNKGEFNLPAEYRAGYTPPAPAKSAPAPKAGAGTPSSNEQALLAALADNNKKKPQREFEDLFLRSLTSVQGKNEVAQLKLTGKENYAEQAMAEFKAHWLGGDFDAGHDPKNRMFKKDSSKLGKNKKDFGIEDADFDNEKKMVKIGNETKSVKDWVAAWVGASAAQKEAAEQAKANTFALERKASTETEAIDALERITNGTDKQTAAMKALNREFAAEEARNPASKDSSKSDYSAYTINKRDSLTNRASADAGTVANDIVGKTDAINAKLKSDAQNMLLTKEQIAGQELDAVIASEQGKYDAVKESLDKQIAEEIKYGHRYEEVTIRAIAIRKKLEEDFNAYLASMAKKRAEDTKSPLQRQVDQWNSSFKDIEQAQANWANQMMQGIFKITDGGFKNFKDFKNGVRSLLAGMATDVSHMLMQKAVGGMVGQVAGMFGNGAKSLFSAVDKPDGSNATKAIWTKSADGAATGLDAPGAVPSTTTADPQQTFFDKLMGSFSGLWANIKGMFSGITSTIMNLFSGVGSSIMSMFSGGGGSGGGGGLLGGIMGMFGGGGMGAGGATEAFPGAGLGSGSAGGGILDTVMSLFSFANGGIMTNRGSIPLHKYATGGVATSPQLALFGEAGPEAYVPLPDGRSIPVSMKNASKSNTDKGGNGSPNVTISIVVNQSGNGTGTETSKTSGSDPAQWDQLANKVKTVVRQEMISQQRPGGLLYK